MGTEFLRPQDCLIRPVTSFRKPNPNPNPRSRRRREGSSRPKNQLVMGQATILKRGQSLDSKAKIRKEDMPSTVSDPAVLCPGPVRLETGRISDVYAGSAFATTSPSPSTVPLPSFSKRKEMDCFATQDLRRILGLD